MKHLKLVALSALLISCGGGSFNAQPNEIAGNSPIGEAGASQIEENGGSSGMANISAGSSSISGNSGTSNAGSSSIGGMNNIAGSNNGGNAGIAGNTSCVPITCDDFSLKQVNKVGMTCGSIDDGCGHMIDCIANKSEGNAICPKFFKCGGGGVTYSSTSAGGVSLITSIPNICGGGCSINPDFNATECTTDRPSTIMCNNNLPSYTSNDLPIGVDCVKSTNAPSSMVQKWCCTSIN